MKEQYVLKHTVAVAVAYESCEKLAIAQLVLYQPGTKQKIGCNISIVMERLPAPALQHNLSVSAGVRAAAADVDDGEEAAMWRKLIGVGGSKVRDGESTRDGQRRQRRLGQSGDEPGCGINSTRVNGCNNNIAKTTYERGDFSCAIVVAREKDTYLGNAVAAALRGHTR
jgi:hypothetical protein